MIKFTYRKVVITLMLMILGLLGAALPLQVEAAGKIVVSGTYANVRSSANISSALISKINKGETFSVLKESQGWYQIQLRNGKKGWVAGWLVKPASKPVSSKKPIPSAQSKTTVKAGNAEIKAALKPMVNKKTTGSGLATIKGTSVNLRSGPATSYKLAGKIQKGATIKILQSNKDWYQVRLSDGRTGWVAGWLVVQQAPVNNTNPEPTMSQTGDVNNGSDLATIKGTFANLRSGPATSYDLAGKIQKGETIKILKGNKDWYQVRLSDGRTGWVASWLVAQKAQGNTSPAPTLNQAGYVSTGSGESIDNNPKAGNSPVNENNQSNDNNQSNGNNQGNGSNQGSDSGQSKENDENQGNGSAGNDGSTGTGSGTGSGETAVQLPCPARISSPTVNLRSGPGSDTAIITKLSQGTRVEAQRQEGSWLEVKLSDGTMGWVAGWLVKFVGKTNNLEIRIETGEQNRIIIMGSEPIVYETSEQREPNRLVVKISDSALSGNAQEIPIAQNGLIKVSTGPADDDQASVQVNVELEPGLRWAVMPGDSERMIILVPADSNIGNGQNGNNQGNSNNLRTVAIDPGHGGIDPGATGQNKLQEKDVVFDISKRVGQKLEAAGYRVVFTRTDDTKITLTRRPVIAAENNADIFVSIHANSSESPLTNGTSTYYYAPSSVPSLAAQEAERRRLAQTVQNNMIRVVGRKNLGIKQENFAVLRGTTMPSILVETAYLSYSEEENLLALEEIREQFAQAIFDGIKQYFEESPTAQ